VGGTLLFDVVTPRIISASSAGIMFRVLDPADARRAVLVGYDENFIPWAHDLYQPDIARWGGPVPVTFVAYAGGRFPRPELADEGKDLFFWSYAMHGDYDLAAAVCRRWPDATLYEIWDRAQVGRAYAARVGGESWTPAAPPGTWHTAVTSLSVVKARTTAFWTSALRWMSTMGPNAIPLVGGIPEPIKRSRVSIEQVAIAATDTLDDFVAVASAATRIIAAGILPEPPPPCCPGHRDLRRLTVVDDPKAAPREDGVARDPGAAVGPARVHVDERQPAGGAGNRLHERLGLVQRHGVRGIAFIGLEVEGEEGPWSRAGRLEKECCLLRAGGVTLAKMIGAPQ